MFLFFSCEYLITGSRPSKLEYKKDVHEDDCVVEMGAPVKCS